MLARTRTLLLGAGISGALVFLAPVAHAIDGLVLENEEPAAHDGDAVNAVGFAAGVDEHGHEKVWVVSGGEDATLRSWTLELQLERVQFLDHEVYDLEAPIDGLVVATGEGGWNGGTSTDTLRIWPTDGFDADSALDHVGTGAPIGFVYVVAVSPSPDNTFTAASGFYGRILVYDTSSLTLCATKDTGKKRTKAIAFSPDGKILAATWKGGTIQLWSFDDQSCELVLLPVSMSHGGTWDLSLAFSPDSDSHETKIVSGTDSGVVKVWTIEDPHGTPIVSVDSVASGGVRSLVWSPNGSMIVTGGNGDITVYNADTLGILAQEENAHTSRVNDVAFSPDGSKIASGGNDGAVKLWQAPVPAACSADADCDGDSGICCSGSCIAAACSSDLDCNDADSCSTDTCTDGGTCAAACDNSFPACSLDVITDGCCGPSCDQSSDLDCAPPPCVPTHNKEKGPRCSDGLDNDCDGMTDGFDPDC